MLLASDEDFLYLSKPAGLPVFPRRTSKSQDESGDEELGDCMLGRLLDALPEQSVPNWPDGFGGGILHRLDNWTSGLLVAARSLEALTLGRGLFSGGTLRKTYLFLSQGDVDWSEHTVERPIAHAKGDRRKMVWQRGRNTPHRGAWRPAKTSFQRVEGALWRAQMSEGVRHQIRLHAASVGLPLQGDRLYGGGGEGRFYLHHEELRAWPARGPRALLPRDWPGPRPVPPGELER